MSTTNSPYPPKKVGLAPNLNSGFYGQDIISVSQFTRESLDYIFSVAEEMRAIVKRAGSTDLLKGTVLACLHPSSPPCRVWEAPSFPSPRVSSSRR